MPLGAARVSRLSDDFTDRGLLVCGGSGVLPVYSVFDICYGRRTVTATVRGGLQGEEEWGWIDWVSNRRGQL